MSFIESSGLSQGKNPAAWAMVAGKNPAAKNGSDAITSDKKSAVQKANEEIGKHFDEHGYTDDSVLLSSDGIDGIAATADMEFSSEEDNRLFQKFINAFEKKIDHSDTIAGLLSSRFEDIRAVVNQRLEKFCDQAGLAQIANILHARRDKALATIDNDVNSTLRAAVTIEIMG